MDKDIVMALALFTIGAVLVIGIISWTRAKKARDHHDDAAVAHRERREPDHVAEEGEHGRTWSEERGANPPTPTKLPPD